MWSLDDIEVEIDDEWTEGPIVTAKEIPNNNCYASGWRRGLIL